MVVTSPKLVRSYDLWYKLARWSSHIPVFGNDSDSAEFGIPDGINPGPTKVWLHLHVPHNTSRQHTRMIASSDILRAVDVCELHDRVHVCPVLDQDIAFPPRCASNFAFSLRRLCTIYWCDDFLSAKANTITPWTRDEYETVKLLGRKKMNHSGWSCCYSTAKGL